MKMTTEEAFVKVLQMHGIEHAFGIIGSAFLMACLHKGAADLDLETNFLTRDYSRVLQAIIIFCVAASYYFFNRKKISIKAKLQEEEL